MLKGVLKGVAEDPVGIGVYVSLVPRNGTATAKIFTSKIGAL